MAPFVPLAVHTVGVVVVNVTASFEDADAVGPMFTGERNRNQIGDRENVIAWLTFDTVTRSWSCDAAR